MVIDSDSEHLRPALQPPVYSTADSTALGFV